jgi:predicted metalloprotease with PDZ domain
MNLPTFGRRSLWLGLCVLLAQPACTWAAEPGRVRPLEVHVDATQAARRLLRARLVIPAQPGPLTLYYPKWIPGEHAPAGPIADLAGLTFHAGGKPLAWRRDDVDLYALHLTVPVGADSVEATLEYLAPSAKDSFAPCALSARLAVLNWHPILLYPRGQPVRAVRAQASLTLPAGWKLGTALPIEATKGALTQFETVSLETLVDSPVLCGVHVKEIPIGPAEGPPHFLVLACDSSAGLEISAEWKEDFTKLVTEAGALFGARHYRSYRFLVAMSDQLYSDAIEHHQCSDNRMPERFLLEDSHRKSKLAWLLPHEYVHSWNGKYRRPEGLATTDYQQPMKTRMLWVYEGLTQYLGFVLTARSGIYTAEVSHANFAQIADWARNQTGRGWRALEDTAAAAPHLYGARSDWASRRRSVDFYDEGALLWLDVDTLIREKTGGKKSLDDFCRAFFGGADGPPEVKTYSFEDLVQALNGVVAYDWKEFLEKRVAATRTEPPLDGLKRGGWTLSYQAEPSKFLQVRQDEDKSVDLTSSIGLLLKDDGVVTDVVANKSADKARVGPGMKLLAVNGRRWSAERLREAVTATPTGGKLLLLLENGEFFETLTLDYNEGAKFPYLKSIEGKPDLLADLLRPRTSNKVP